MKKNNGITLIALIITIIVMLILVGVTVNVALNGGLFEVAKKAASKTEIAMETEELYSAAIGAMKSRGKVNFTNLDKNLPQGFSGTQGTYTSSESEQTYKVSSDGTVKVIEPLEIVVGQYKTSAITIGAIIELTDDEASQIAGSAFGLETNNLREFIEAFMELQEMDMTYDNLVTTLTEQTDNPNPSDRDVFAFLFAEMGFETVQQLAEIAIAEGMVTYQPEVKLTINGDDKTDIYNEDGFEYDVEYGETYEIKLQIDEKIATKTVKIEAGKPYGWDMNKVELEEVGENIVPIPKEFDPLSEITENSINEGLVIKNGQNEFVWVPVNNPGYTETVFGLLETIDDGSKVQTDSYQTIQYYYGNTLGEMNSEEDFEEVFTFIEDQENIEQSIRTYGGFYVGRYETTFNSIADNGTVKGIGVELGQNVLRVTSNYKVENGELKKCRWWGLYKAQKDMYSNNSNVGSLMITIKQWDEIMRHTGYGETERASTTYAKTPELSGAPYKGTTDVYDVTKNIYDLAGNMSEYTMNKKTMSVFGTSLTGRAWQGDDYDSYMLCKASAGLCDYPNKLESYYGSRVTLYIK